MSVVLSVYSEAAYKEYVLPAIRNEETTLIVDHVIFHLRQDFELNLENIDGVWYFRDDAKGQIRSRGQNTLNKIITDASNYQIITQDGDELAIIVTVKDTSFESYRKYLVHGQKEISVGFGTENTIRYSYQYHGAQFISSMMMLLRPHGNSAEVEDRGRNGIFVNDRRVSGSRIIQFGDHIHIWGLDMVYLGDILAIRDIPSVRVDTNQMPAWEQTYTKPLQQRHESEKEIWHRAPRNIEKLETDPVEIEAPPQPRAVEEMPLLMVIGPALTMVIPMAVSSAIAIIASRATGTEASIFMYTGIITALCSAIIAVFWAITNLHHNKKRIDQAEQHRMKAYRRYLEKKEREIASKYQKNRRAMELMYPSAAECISPEMKTRNLLWCRNATHDDYMQFRLGLGECKFQAEIQIPKEKFSLIDDSLSDMPEQIREKYENLHSVPINLDLLSNNIIGILGGKEKRGAYAIVRALVAQIAAQNCYTDIKLCFVYEKEQGEDGNQWEFARWLPHVWSQDKKVRYVASTKSGASDVFFELGKIFRDRLEAQNGLDAGKKNVYKPHYIVFIEDDTILEGELISRYIYEKMPDVGVTFVLLAENYEDLPNTCECIIQNDGQFSGLVNIRNSERTQISFDNVEAQQLEQFARELSNLTVVETEVGGDIPNAITFLEMYGVDTMKQLHVVERWKKNRTYKTMRALVGQMAGGKPCYLDVHEKYHGPHGLVAGTTGSGKSETLQTYIMSLALNFSPDDVGFFIIDYKGGGMANLFRGLPHLLGSVSNLSGNQVRRAMVSIKSENRRRQTLFNENGVNNINAYTQLYKNGEATQPIPHLFIIIDEFAELKREESDFMKELISVAQVGRSLGVHLILATQKPSGTVDDNIWSNAKFRLCLRVQDRQDSMDMLHKPDAAYLTQAGRCYMQVGNDELFQMFQSGCSGAAYDEEVDHQKQVVATMLADSGKAALVGSHVMRKRREQKKFKWFSKLLEYVNESQKVTQNDNELIDVVIQCMKADRVDYANTEYNRRLLENYLQLCARVEREGNDSIETMVKRIILIAERENIRIPEQKDRTQLDALIEYLAGVAQKEHYRKPQKLWLDVLPKMIPISKLENRAEDCYADGNWPIYAERWHLKALIGLCDDPENQLQMPQEIDFTENGNYAVLGMAMSGKSTLIQTVLYGLISHYSPDYLNIYLIDFSNQMLSCFERAPHCGGILRENDIETVGKFFRMLRKNLEHRKELFRGGNYSQFVMTHGVVVPAVVVALDNMANFREKTEGRYDDELLQITRECAAYGVYFLISGAGYNASEIPGRMRDNIHGVICLEMMDKFQYSDALNVTQLSLVPESGIQGRGLTIKEGRVLEFQACVAVESDDDYKRRDTIEALAGEMNQFWHGTRAMLIPKIPTEPNWKEFKTTEECVSYYADDRHLPVGYDQDTAEIYAVDLSKIYTYLVQGKANTGKKNFLKLVGLGACERGGRVVIIERGVGGLKRFADSIGAEYISDYAGFRTFMLEDFIPLFQQRNRIKQECVMSGMEADEIYERMHQEREVYLLIPDLADFVEMMYAKDSVADNMNGGIANLIDKGALHNIYFFAAMAPDARNRLMGKDIFEKYVRDRKGIHFGGAVSQQRLFEFSEMSMSEQSAADQPGVGTIPSSGNEMYHKVITPLVKAKRKSK